MSRSKSYLPELATEKTNDHGWRYKLLHNLLAGVAGIIDLIPCFGAIKRNIIWCEIKGRQ